MQGKARDVCLTFLRLAIGWHFLYEGMWKLMQQDGWSCLSYLGAAQGPLAPLFKWMGSQSWIVATGDWAVQLGLVAIGLSLMTGILARIAALAGIALMAMFYCCQPPEPFATAMSGADGRFFLLERNAIEALGLALIAAMPCWRGFLRTLLPGAVALAVFGGCFWSHYRAGGFKKVAATTSATVKVHEFTALKALSAPFAEKANVAGVEISRLALGGDLIAGHSHARDLIWTDEFMHRYNSGATLGRTVRYCIHCGIDTAFVELQNLMQMVAETKAAGGKMKFFANCKDGKEAAKAAAEGASGAYMRPQVADELAKKGDAAGLKSLFSAFKTSGVPAGIGAEALDTVKFCADNGVVPDFWVLAFHSLDYPAATMETRCNNIWCTDPKAAAEYMKTRKEPWVAIRGLAGGAIKPEDAYRFAKENGATAVAIDLLDYRIVETVNAIMKKKADPAKKAPAAKGKEVRK